MIVVYLVTWLLKLPLSLRARTRLIGAILDRIEALPLADIIKEKGGVLYVDGMPVDMDMAVKLREGAKLMLHNSARRIVYQQVASIAGKRGVVEGDTPEKLYFYRAALWWGLTEEDIYKQLAGE